MAKSIEELCRPLIGLVLSRCRLARSGAAVDASSLKGEVRSMLDGIRNEAEQVPMLKRDFERIERPLVFFIDYLIKEGSLPFSADWVELARDYNELSGDEKFFDLLADTLEDPESQARLKMFYQMIGLGFDGCRRGDGEFLERRMRLCATRFPEMRRLEMAELFSPAEATGFKVSRHRRVLAVSLAVALVFAASALFLNVLRFGEATEDYRSALFECMNKSVETIR